MKGRRVDLVGIVETFYRLDLGRGEWLARASEVLRPLLDRHNLGITGNFYECVDPCSYVPDRLVVCDVPVKIAAEYTAYLSHPSPTFIADSVLSRSCYFCLGIPRATEIRGEFGRISTLGAVDKLTLNVVEPDGTGCCFGSFQADRSPLSAQAHLALQHVAAHLAAAFRLRRTLESKRIPEATSAVMDANGQVQHASGVAKNRLERERLTTAVRALDRARTRKARSDSMNAVQDWKAVVGKRWMLMDHVERDGRRFVLAVETTTWKCLDLLSPRERDVVRRMMNGQTNKEIAYDLGLAPSTVRVLVMRAAAKVGVHSRADLRAKASALGLHAES